ncbi:hypothetical protein CF328_g9197, partial [Tilletia controversa]
TSTKPEKNRVCFNASWPRLEHTDANAQAGEGIKSINEEVKDEGWECEWFLLEEVKTLLSTATTTATVMGFDLSDAYQQVPNLPAQRQRFVFSVEGQFFVWVVGMFGIATMSAIFGQLCDVLCAWLEHRFPSVRARHFADDHMVMRDAPVPTEDEVYEEVKFFGWKVHPTKRFGWTRQFALLGFTWDLDAGTVAIGEEKRDKYLRKLTIFQNKEKVTYRDVSSMLGTLVHTCAVFASSFRLLQGEKQRSGLHFSSSQTSPGRSTSPPGHLSTLCALTPPTWDAAW